MIYGKEVQKAKANRSDHRKARAVAGSVNRNALKRDSKKFKTLEREHDQDRRFGGSLKSVYFDSDGDGYKDTYGRLYRGGVAGKSDLVISTSSPESPESPESGISVLTASVKTPGLGPSGLVVSTLLPETGPGTLTVNPISTAPATAPIDLTAGVESPVAGPIDLTAGVNSPATAPIDLTAGLESPVAGPSGLSASIPTLNIEIVSDQSFADDPNSGSLGEIKYSSDIEFLFIHNGTEWIRTDGGNS